MADSHLHQWWESTYRHHKSKQTFNSHGPHDFQSSEINLEVNVSIVNQLQQFGNDNFGVYLNHTFTNSPYYLNDNGENSISSLTLLIMAITFGFVIFGGVFGNAILLFTLLSNSSVRLRNPLLLAVCVADLLVTGISAPTTFFNISFNRNTYGLPLMTCKIVQYVQVMPVAASTISFFMLSIDRCVTVRYPFLAQIRQRRYFHLLLALLSWIISAALSTPFLFSYQIMSKNTIDRNEKSVLRQLSTSELLFSAKQNNNLETYLHTSTRTPKLRINCNSTLNTGTIFVSFIIFHTFVVFIIPGLGVLLNHYGVRQKLCALSLTARAAHGELPLPMPILRRQTHIVIVTGIANAQQAADCGATDDTSNEADIQMQHFNPNWIIGHDQEHIRSSTPISPRAMREIRAHTQRQRIGNNPGPAAPGMPLPRTSTLHSRRRLANMLIASALIFIFCWAPHVFCILYTNLGYRHYCSKTSNSLHLLLGYCYSALSPVIYWILNHNTLKQSPCAPIIRLRSMQQFLRTRFRSNTVPQPPSSTNEAALGAFNPKLVKLTPKQYRAQASSHYLY